MTQKNRVILLAGALLVVSIVVLVLLLRLPKTENQVEDIEQAIPEVPEVILAYGLPVDSFRIEEYRVRKNENLSEILLPRGISYGQIDQLAKKSKSIFDVRKIKAGKDCFFFFTKDSVEELAHMVYEQNLEEYVTYSFLDSIEVATGQKEIVLETRQVQGNVESSLWNAMVSKNVSTKIAMELSDIYAWTIDFFGIQKGDAFNVIYTVKMIDGEAIGVNEILASSFTHGGKDHWAYVFEQDEKRSYFDAQGQSLERAFLKAPFSYRPRISSGYTNRRLHPILRVYRPHRGIDYAAPQGTPVLSIGDGKVAGVSYDKASGHYIKIKHNSVYTSGYLHLQYKPKHRVGSYIKQSETIGYVGKTGYATGPHLDFRIWKNGQLVNPSKIESPPVEPVKANYQARFDSIVQGYNGLMNQSSLINPLI